MTPGNIPWWLIFVLGVVAGAVGTLAIGPSSDAFWEAVYIVRRWCLIVGGVVLFGGTIAGAVYLIYYFKFAQSS